MTIFYKQEQMQLLSSDRGIAVSQENQRSLRITCKEMGNLFF